MVVFDANILIYAHFEDTSQHHAINRWLEAQLAGPEIIGLSWTAIWAFIRAGTNARLWPRPPAIEALFDRVQQWLDEPHVVLLEPGPRHLALLQSVMLASKTTGTGTTDAALAAIAIEHAATLASTDRNFRRFSGLRWVDPLED